MVDTKINFLKNAFLLQSKDEIQKGEEYDDLSYLDKMKILVNQQLDKLIDQETKDSFNQNVANSNAEIDELSNKRILNQEVHH